MNFSLAPQKKINSAKLGLTIEELKEFVAKYFIKLESEYSLKMHTDTELSKRIHDFVSSYGLDAVDGVEDYLYGIIYENLSGYDYDSLDEEEFKHVGGPILLSLK